MNSMDIENLKAENLQPFAVSTVHAHKFLQ